jgi:hypothetical protein
MAKLHQLKTFSSEKGNLTIFEKLIPGTIQRVFYIYGAQGASRGGAWLVVAEFMRIMDQKRSFIFWTVPTNAWFCNPKTGT